MAVAALGHVAEEPQRWLVDEVEVVDREQDRRALGESREHAEERVVAVMAGVVAEGRGLGHALEQLPHHAVGEVALQLRARGAKHPQSARLGEPGRDTQGC